MKDNLFNAIQIATGFAVVIGLIMVFIELQQAKSLSLAELTSEGYSEALADFRTVMGENPAPTIAKSCFNPEALNPEEMVVLHAYYNSKIGQIARLRVLELVADYGVPWRVVANQHLSEVVSTQPGRVWFERHLKADQEVYALGTKLLESGLDCTSVIASNSLLPD